MAEVLLFNACVIGVLMLVVWLGSLLLKDVSIVDIAWGMGFVVVAWASYFLGQAGQKQPLLPALVTIWGLRLSGYLAWRKTGSPEDFRYAAMRQRNPRAFPFVSLLTVFALQGVLMWTVALPLQTVGLARDSSVMFTVVGILLWVTGVACESLGDWQLAAFKADPNNRGKVLDRGLWRYTRHPNYFGDFLVWWGLYLIALGSGGPWWSVVGPAIMSVLLMRVSGVTLLEKSLVDRKEGYADYVARTSSFFPWWPRNRKQGVVQ